MAEHRRAKIVCTLGPATFSSRKIVQLIKAGMDVVRLNFSHGTVQQHARTVRIVRKAASGLGKPIAILLDLPGPKIRVGDIAGGEVELKAGRQIVLTGRRVVGTEQRISSTYPNMAKDVWPGDRILIDDGRIHLRVRQVDGRDIRCRIEHGGTLYSQKGINLPGSALSIPSLTPRDREGLAFGLEAGVDYLAVSFVRTEKDLQATRRFMRRKGGAIPLVAKIEKPQAVENLDAILDETDAVMVARGDLGVELLPERVPLVQKAIIDAANIRGYAVITATEMLFSMIENPQPTRAEASDVANAILDGTDAVMLSGETATGRYPVEAVKMMSRIIRETERCSDACFRDFPDRVRTPSTVVASAACQAAEEAPASAIVAFTRSGLTARLVSKHRPRVRIFAYTTDRATLRRLSLDWGVTAFHIPIGRRINEMIERVEADLLQKRLVRPRDIVVFVGSTPVLDGGPTNLMKVHTVKSRR
ncbi:MAG: pyruvate kinase [Nitrospinota bacterium]|nr:pyruvate kinase [Nitrospinota bacterium]